MAIKTYNDQNFVAIANAIRAKNGETTQYKPSEMAAAISALETALELLPQDTAAGAIANFPDGSNNYPVVELIANIDPKQSGSGDPAPDNVRPISGFTVVNLTKNGKNLAQFVNGYGIGTDGLPQPTTNRVSTLNPIAIKSNVTYKVVSETNQKFIYAVLNGLNLVRRIANISSGSTIDTSGGDTLYLCMYNANNELVTVEDDKPMCILSTETNTDYEPYISETRTISWESEAGTVYKGTLNVTTGELTVTHGIKTFNGTESWNTYGNYNGFSISVSTMKSGVRQDGVCNMLTRSTTSTQGQTNAFWLGENTKVIYIIGVYESMGNTLEAFKEYLSTHNLTFVFPLETPETYQLEPEEVKTLLGVNNIYADTGDVEVTYRADIDLYIAKKIAEGA